MVDPLQDVGECTEGNYVVQQLLTQFGDRVAYYSDACFTPNSRNFNENGLLPSNMLYNICAQKNRKIVLSGS